MKKKLLFLVNVDWFFLSHRLPIALAALNYGYEVHIATSITDKHAKLCSYGFTVHPLPLGRGKTNLLGEISTFTSIIKVLRAVRPDLLHLVTIKPVLYGGIAARLVGIKNVVAAISGLGYIFIAKGYKAAIRRRLIANLYRFALSQPRLQVILQNHDDKKILTKAAKLKPQQIHMIPGSGVNLNTFPHTAPSEGIPIVVMASRLLSDKGVYEFVEAATHLRKQGISAIFQLAGEPDPENPASIPKQRLADWHKQQIVQILGHRNDIAELFSHAHIIVLPSYREGFPKVLIEAAACGRAVVTTDVPGCRDAIIPNETGSLVPVRDPGALATAIERLVLDINLRNRMGQAGRKLAEKQYTIEQVVTTHLDIYQKLIDKK